MFEDLQERLEGFRDHLQNLEQGKVSIKPDENGMIDKQCPIDECNSFFKVNDDDWHNIIKEDAYCPHCGQRSEKTNFFPKEQVAETRRAAKDYVDKYLNKEKLTQRGTNIVIEFDPRPKIDPQLQCSNCSVRYAGENSPHFCPNCGKESKVA